jgi:hypothetical protein
MWPFRPNDEYSMFRLNDFWPNFFFEKIVEQSAKNFFSWGKGGGHFGRNGHIIHNSNK